MEIYGTAALAYRVLGLSVRLHSTNVTQDSFWNQLRLRELVNVVGPGLVDVIQCVNAKVSGDYINFV